LFAPRIYIVVLRAHPVHGESHIQRNATGEVQQQVVVKSRFGLHATCLNYFCGTTVPSLSSQTAGVAFLGVEQRNYSL